MTQGLQKTDQLAEVGAQLQRLPQVPCPLQHYFSEGCYFRRIQMPGVSPEHPHGVMIVGAAHKTRHLNIVFSGRCRVLLCDTGEVKEIDARSGPVIFESLPGCRKVLHILETTDWATVHVTTETDLAKLADLLLEKPQEHWHYLTALDQQRLLDHANQS